MRHHEIEWHAHCANPQPAQSWARASTCKRPTKRSHARTWLVLGVAIASAIVLTAFGV